MILKKIILGLDGKNSIKNALKVEYQFSPKRPGKNIFFWVIKTAPYSQKLILI
jgi:hypothetical protein